ncbi:MAG: nuclear transport factor 2 family protein [Dermatophilaceae bacterium]
MNRTGQGPEDLSILTDGSGDGLADLVELWSAAAQAYMNGDLRTYAVLARHGADYTLMPPFGGDPRRGFDDSDEAVEWTARTFRGGTADVEVFQTYACGDLAVVVAVERQHGSVEPLPSQDWSLRVTLVFRRESGAWRLVHRHADPLTRATDPELCAAIARGDHTSS